MSQNPHILDVNQASFARDVLQHSQQTPVIVDFWAPWCGPCRMLGPTLERLAAEYNGRFRLAKLNSDLNPQLSQQYNVRGIPAVKAFVNGRVVDEFVGAQPEPMVRQFLQRVLAQAPQPQSRPKASSAPATPAEKLHQAKRYLSQGDGCAAQPLLQGLSTPEAAALQPLAQFLCDASQGRLAGANALYSQVADAIRRRDYTAALYNLLTLRNQEPNGRAQKVMEGLFTLLGNENATVQAYRQQL